MTFRQHWSHYFNLCQEMCPEWSNFILNVRSFKLACYITGWWYFPDMDYKLRMMELWFRLKYRREFMDKIREEIYGHAPIQDR